MRSRCLFAAWLFLSAVSSDAWTMPSKVGQAAHRQFSRRSPLFSKLTDEAKDELLSTTKPSQMEKALREKLSDETSKLDDEAKYAVLDGAFLEKLDEPSSADAATLANAATASDTTLADKITRMTKPRAYPLFLMEKAAELVEGMTEKILHQIRGEEHTGGKRNESWCSELAGAVSAFSKTLTRISTM